MKRFRRIADRAEEELDRHTEPPAEGDRKWAPRGADDVEALRAEQQAETAQTLTSGGPVWMTNAQWKGMVLGGLVGGLIGAVVLLPVALIPFVDGVLLRIFFAVLIGFLAGAAAGAVFWGGRTPELEGETMDVNGRPSIGTSLRDAGSDERGRPPHE